MTNLSILIVGKLLIHQMFLGVERSLDLTLLMDIAITVTSIVILHMSVSSISNGGNFDGYCYTCNQYGHKVEDRRSKVNVLRFTIKPVNPYGRERQFNVTCLVCGNYVHLLVNCKMRT